MAKKTHYEVRDAFGNEAVRSSLKEARRFVASTYVGGRILKVTTEDVPLKPPRKKAVRK